MEHPNSYDNDIPAAPLDDDEPEVRHERPDPYDVEVDRQAEVRGIQQDMSALGRNLFTFAVGLSRAQAKGEL